MAGEAAYDGLRWLLDTLAVQPAWRRRLAHEVEERAGVVARRRDLGKLLTSDDVFGLVAADDAEGLGHVLLPAVKTPVLPVDLGRAAIDVLRARANRDQKLGFADLEVGRSLQQGQVVLLDGIYDLMEGQAAIYERVDGAPEPHVAPGPVCDPRAREFHAGALVGRADEYQTLGEWFQGPSGGYRVIVGGPWAGKTAVMSELALAPPADVDVVSFFIRAVGRRNTGAHFLDVVNGQLRRLLGEPETAGQSGQDLVRRRSTFEELWAKAMARALRDGRRLVLLVDGLDEQDGDDELPISALLPGWLEVGCKVLVATRPNPRRHPDMAATHPYHLAVRDPMALAPSRHARAIGELAREAIGLIVRSGDEQMLRTLGLLTVADGPLTTADLADLVGCDVRAMSGLLSDFDRHLVGRGSDDEPWELGHVELLTMSRTELAPIAGLVERCERTIDRWADRHHEKGWPPGTPRYLLTSYWSMLERRKMPRRLAWLVSDPFEAQTIATVRTRRPAIDAATAGLRIYERNAGGVEDEDVRAICTLCVRRVEMRHVAAAFPVAVVGAWAKLGAWDEVARLLDQIPPERGLVDALIAAANGAPSSGSPTTLLTYADSIEDPAHRHRALVSVASAVAVRDPAAADAALERAEEAAEQIPGYWGVAPALLATVEAVASRISTRPAALDQVRRLIDKLPRPSQQSTAWTAVASAIAATDIEEAKSAFRYAKDLAQRAAARGEASSALANVVAAIARHMPSDHAAMGLASQTAQTIVAPWSMIRAWAAIAAACAGNDRTAAASAVEHVEHAIDQAVREAGHDPRASARGARLEDLVRELARTGFAGSSRLLGRATAIATRIEDPNSRRRALLHIASALADHDLPEADAVLDQVERAGHGIGEHSSRPWPDKRTNVVMSVALTRVVRNPRDRDLVTRAAWTAQRIGEPSSRCEAWLRIASVIAGHDTDGALLAIAVAERTADHVAHRARGATLARVAAAFAATAPTNHVAIERAQEVAARIDDPQMQSSAWARIADALASPDPAGARSCVERAERAAQSTADPWTEQAWRLTAGALAAHDADETHVAFERAERVAEQIDAPWRRAEELAALAKLLFVHDSRRAQAVSDRATSAAEEVDGARLRCWAWVRIASALADHSPLAAREAMSNAEGIARSIADPHDRSQAWIAVVDGLVAQHPADPTAIQRAERAADLVDRHGNEGWALQRIASALASASPGDPLAIDRARRVADRIEDPLARDEALHDITSALASLHPGDASAIDRAERAARAISHAEIGDRARATLASALARGDPVDETAIRRAEQMTEHIGDAKARCEALLAIASALTDIDPTRAEDAFLQAEHEAEAVDDPSTARKAWTALASALAGHDPARSRAAFERAEQEADQINYSPMKGHALIAIAGARAVDPDSAWTMLARIARDPAVHDDAAFLPTLVRMGGPTAANAIGHLLTRT